VTGHDPPCGSSLVVARVTEAVLQWGLQDAWVGQVSDQVDVTSACMQHPVSSCVYINPWVTDNVDRSVEADCRKVISRAVL
jgi:hypothetical protein